MGAVVFFNDTARGLDDLLCLLLGIAPAWRLGSGHARGIRPLLGLHRWAFLAIGRVPGPRKASPPSTWCWQKSCLVAAAVRERGQIFRFHAHAENSRVLGRFWEAVDYCPPPCQTSGRNHAVSSSHPEIPFLFVPVATLAGACGNQQAEPNSPRVSARPRSSKFSAAQRTHGRLLSGRLHSMEILRWCIAAELAELRRIAPWGPFLPPDQNNPQAQRRFAKRSGLDADAASPARIESISQSAVSGPESGYC